MKTPLDDHTVGGVRKCWPSRFKLEKEELIFWLFFLALHFFRRETDSAIKSDLLCEKAGWN